MIIADIAPHTSAKIGVAKIGAARVGVAPTNFANMINSPVRQIKARAELYNGAALVQIFGYEDALKELAIERVGDGGKFFGFGVCQKLSLKLIDVTRAINITTDNTLEVEFGVESDYVYPCPFFNVTEVHRDENTNELSITAYDAIYRAKDHKESELTLPDGTRTIKDYALACAKLLGLPLKLEGVQESVFATEYAQSANFEGTESVRDVLDDIAEATQTIYFINSEWRLTFKRLDRDGAPVLTIDKEKYIELESKTNRRLTGICSATELGDNVEATMEQQGTTQYVRDNAFWELREDIDELVENALASVGGLTINQFSCNWRGNFLLEIGDKVALTTKDGDTVTAYVLNDTISYNGFFSQRTEWSYTGDDGETASNPSTLGEALKQTYARVDKANKQITMLASETADNTEKVASLLLTTEDLKISIKQAETSGATKVETETGFTFDADGLTVSKTGSEMSTQITEDGMTVSRDNTEVLRADHEGVNAANLHATTYLIIGENSRFEDYENTRTACFWIGG